MDCIQTELPSINRDISKKISEDSLLVVGINKSSSVSWLKTYSSMYGISYPFIFNQNGNLFNSYQVGSAYGNIPPTYIIIDTKGIVKYRTDDKFNRTNEMYEEIKSLLVNSP